MGVHVAFLCRAVASYFGTDHATVHGSADDAFGDDKESS